MRIVNIYKDKNNIENITLLTQCCISTIRQMRVAETDYIIHDNGNSPLPYDIKVR